jgi:hypothetical protein
MSFKTLAKVYSSCYPCLFVMGCFSCKDLTYLPKICTEVVKRLSLSLESVIVGSKVTVNKFYKLNIP